MITRAPIVVGLALRADDDAPLALGRALSDLTGAPLALVHAYHLDPLLPSVDARLRHEALHSLERLAARLRPNREVSVHVWPASPSACLHLFADRFSAGLLVVGSSARGRHGRMLAGGTALRLLHGAPCAVAVAPRGHRATKRLRHIGVAFDGSPESEDALVAGIGLALQSGSALRTYTVAEPGRPDAAAVAELVPPLVPEGVLEGTDVLTGTAAEALAGVSVDVDLMVCGSRGYGALRSVFLGSCSRALVDRAACPLVVLPRGPDARLGVLAPATARSSA